MYFNQKILKESEAWLKVNCPNRPWTAEFNIGWAMSHRPLWLLMSFVECGLSMFFVVGIIYFLTKNIGLSVLGGVLIPMTIEIILIFKS